MQNKDTNTVHDSKKIVLTSKEISELLAEGIVTVILLLLLNVSLLVILSAIIKSSPNLQDAIFETKFIFSQNLDNDLFWSGRNFIIPIFLIVDALVLYWRLHRRYKQMQLRHIISELHYIAEGNYDYRIPFELKGDLNRIIQSINGLVDSTMMAIEEERKIEQSKDELITNVSHDIRTPLTVLKGNSEMLAAKVDELSVPENVHAMAVKIDRKADDLIATINDYFTMSKISSGDLPLKLRKENISRLCHDTILDYYDLLEKQQFEVDIQIPDTPIFVYTDRDALQRILKNLIDNAIRHGSNGKYISLRLTTTKGRSIIEIEDHGKGMSPQQQKRIFTRNYTTASKSSGSGLGLAISKRLAAQIGAELQVHSIPNEQTVFSIIIKS